MLMIRAGINNQTNPKDKMKESRELERFSLRLPTRVSALERGNFHLDLMTENISAGGAFFPTPTPLPEGMKVLVELTLRRESGEGGAAKVHVKGEVLPPRPTGMAVRFESRPQMTGH
jgi:LuxR family transcriptional regulator, positive regulator of biofilm formation